MIISFLQKMKIYSILLLLSFISFLSCGNPESSILEDSSTVNGCVNKSCGKSYRMEAVVPEMVVGRFVSPSKMDTLFFRYFSNNTHEFIDSLPMWENPEVGDDIDWFLEKDIVMKVTTSDGTVVHTEENAMYVIRVVCLNGLLPRSDALAIVWFPRQFSSIVPCRVVSVKDGQWMDIGSFTVNIGFLPDTLTDGMIDGFLENREGTWMYRDYNDMFRLSEEHSDECPIKPLCGLLNLRAPKEYNLRQNVDFLNYWGIDDDLLLTESDNTYDTTKVESIATTLRSINIRMTPYTNVKEIKTELSSIRNHLYNSTEYYWRACWKNILYSRLEFHLSNPVTYRDWKPCKEYNPFKVSVSPDGRYKFYTTPNIGDGTMGHWVTYNQYHDSDGKLACCQWQGDRRFDYQGNVVDVWQFNQNDTTFYVLKSVWQGSSCEWGYSMEIVTFDNGVPTYHIHFFPNMKEYGEVKKITMKNGELTESDWVKEDGAYCVCHTDRALNVDYTFNPKTLTVTATTQDDNVDRCKTEIWKLKTR